MTGRPSGDKKRSSQAGKSSAQRSTARGKQPDTERKRPVVGRLLKGLGKGLNPKNR